jgi:hypothetical protein
MTNEDIVSNLSSSAYTLINDRMLRGLGGNAYEAIILSKFLSFYKYFYDCKLLTSDGYFFQTIDDLEKLCGISEYYQRSAIKGLESKHLLSVRISGSPPKRYFKYIVSREEKKIQQDKFYKELNSALIFSWKLTQERGGNIPKQLLWFMYVWQDYMKAKGGFEWNTALYGELRNYWRVKYNKKLFNYTILHDFMYLDQPKTIYNFITYDRKTPELAFLDRLIYNEFDIEGEKYEEK